MGCQKVNTARGGKNHTLKGTIGSAINQDGDDAIRLCIALKLSGTYQKPKQKNKPNVILESKIY